MVHCHGSLIADAGEKCLIWRLAGLLLLLFALWSIGGHPEQGKTNKNTPAAELPCAPKLTRITPAMASSPCSGVIFPSTTMASMASKIVAPG